MAKKPVTKKADIVDAEVVSEPPPTPVAIAEPAAPPAPPALTASQQAEIDRIMADAKQKAQQVILGGSPEAKLGTPSLNHEEMQDAYQQDRLPGSYRREKGYVPVFVRDDDSATPRRVLRPADEVMYVLAPADDFLTYTNLGYKFVKYDGGSQSGVLEPGFRGTGDAIFIRELNGNCRRGDCFFMWIPRAAWNEIQQEDLDKQGNEHKRALGIFHNVAYGVGIRPSASVDGVEVF